MPPLVILAGGKATRLGNIVKDIPKSLVMVAGKPFIEHQLKLVASKGIKQVVICIGIMGQQIQDFVGDGSSFGIQVSYSLDGDALLGTGGAVMKALPLLPETFMLMYGDSYLDTNYYIAAVSYTHLTLPTKRIV